MQSTSPVPEPRIDATSRIGDLMAADDRLARALEALGVDSCCGGALNLGQASEARGLPLEDLLTTLRAAVAPKGGLGAAGGAGEAHSSPRPAAVAPGPAVAPPLEGRRLPVVNAGRAAGVEVADAAGALPRRFLLAALISTLTLGATFGAWNLLRMHLALGPVPPDHNAVHATFQVTGFVLLFIMGVAYQTVPRFLGAPLSGGGLAARGFQLAVGGLILRGYGQLGALLPGTLPALMAGALLQLAALATFAGVLVATYRRARPQRETFHVFLAAGTAWWLVAGLFIVAGAAVAVRGGDASLAVALDEPAYLAALYGGTLAWIEGMLLRTGPVFLGLPAPRPALLSASFVLGQLGSYAAVAGAALRGRHAAAETLLDAGLLALAGAVASFAAAVRVFSPPRADVTAPDRPLRAALRLAFGFALAFAALAASYAARDITGRPVPVAFYDGARHAFALGFVTLVILAMAGRMVPVFGGVPLSRPRLHRAGLVLVAAGVVLREAQVVAGAWGLVWPLYLSGPSGAVAAAGLALAAVSIIGTLRAGTRATRARGAAA